MIDIVYIGDANYAPAIQVSAGSALRRAANPGDICVHVVTDDPAFPDIGFDVRRWRGDGREPWHGTELVWSRLDFPSLFPECDWVVSCDADTLWLADPASLWGLRDDSLFLQASRDASAPDGTTLGNPAWWREHGMDMPPDKRYCCGLMLMNLRLMRSSRFNDLCASFLREHPAPPLREQSVLSFAARDASAPLPPEWGVFSFWHTTVARPKLVHYVTDFPWRRDKPNRLMGDIVMLWWRECESLGLAGLFPGVRGCRGRLDYLWRRAAAIALKPLAPAIGLSIRLKAHFRNAAGLQRRLMRELAAPLPHP